MADQLQFDVSKSDDEFFKVSKRQLEIIFTNEKSSALTLVSEDNERYPARWSILQFRWLWLSGLKNAEQARNVNEGDQNQIRITISGKMLYTILKWAYYRPVDLNGWTFSDLRLFIGKCKEFVLPELEDVAKDQVKKMAAEGNVEPAEIGRLFEYGAEVEDEQTMEAMVRLATQRMETVVTTEEFSRFPPQLVAKMAEGLTNNKYPMFVRSIPKWSTMWSSKQLDVVMSKIDVSVLPVELVRKLMSNYAWASDEVRVQLEKWTIVEKNECPVEKELILRVDDVGDFYNVSPSSAADLFSTDRFFQPTGYFQFYLKKEVNCQKVSWNCKQGRVTGVSLVDFDGRGLEVDLVGNCATFSAKIFSGIEFFTTEGALINEVRLTLA